MSEPLEVLAALARRFVGVSLENRRHGTDWPAPWRCKMIVTKNEREDYRIAAYGETAEDAIRALAADVSTRDRQWPTTSP